MIPALSTIVAVYCCARLVLLPLTVPASKQWVQYLVGAIVGVAVILILLNLVAILKAGGLGGGADLQGLGS